MIEIGETLRRIREDCSLTLKEVCEELKPDVSISQDFLSKVENGFRTPQPELIRGLSKVYELPTLIDFYYEIRLHNLLEEHPKPKKLLRKVVKNWDSEPTFHKTSPRSVSGNLPLKDSRRYVRGGRNGKVKGFDFYPNEKGELTPKERKTLLQKSKNWMFPDELDGSLTDIEIVDSWNEFYESNGHSITEFREKWEREFLPSKEEEKKEQRKSKHSVETKKPIDSGSLWSRFTKKERDLKDLG